jgi:hypothetical protein
MTRARIAEGLMLLVMGLANPGTLMDPPDGWTVGEWAFVKGQAAAEILRLHKEVAAAE